MLEIMFHHVGRVDFLDEEDLSAQNEGRRWGCRMGRGQGEKEEVMNTVNVLNDVIEERWDSLTNKEVGWLKESIEATFLVICRRKGSR